ncbi:hypothetical protein Vafri_10829, partial [Volvox africanus]
ATPFASNNLASNPGGQNGNKTAASTSTGSSAGASRNKMLGPVIIGIVVVGCVLLLCAMKVALFLSRRRVGPAGKIVKASSEPSWLTDSAKPASASISGTEGLLYPTYEESLLEETNYAPPSGSANNTDGPTVAAVEWARSAGSMQAVNVLTVATPSATATSIKAPSSPTTVVGSASGISAPFVGSIPANSTRFSLRWRDSQVLPYQVQESQEEAAGGGFLLDNDVEVDCDDDDEEDMDRVSGGDGNQLLASATAISVHESGLLSSTPTIALAKPACWNPLWFESSGSGATPPAMQAAPPPVAARVGTDAPTPFPVGAEYAGGSLTPRALRPVMEKGAAREMTANLSSSWARLLASACRPAGLARNHAADSDSPSALRALFNLSTTSVSSPRSSDIASSTGWWNPLWQAEAAAQLGETTLTSPAVPDAVACGSAGSATDMAPTAHTSHAAAAKDHSSSSLANQAALHAAMQAGAPAAIVMRAETAVVQKAQQVPTAGGPSIPTAVEAAGRKSQSLGAIGIAKAAAVTLSPDVETTSPRWWNAPWLSLAEAPPRTPAPAAKSPICPGATNLGLRIMTNPLAEDGEVGSDWELERTAVAAAEETASPWWTPCAPVLVVQQPSAGYEGQSANTNAASTSAAARPAAAAAPVAATEPVSCLLRSSSGIRRSFPRKSGAAVRSMPMLVPSAPMAEAAQAKSSTTAKFRGIAFNNPLYSRRKLSVAAAVVAGGHDFYSGRAAAAAAASGTRKPRTSSRLAALASATRTGLAALLPSRTSPSWTSVRPPSPTGVPSQRGRQSTSRSVPQSLRTFPSAADAITAVPQQLDGTSGVAPQDLSVTPGPPQALSGSISSGGGHSSQPSSDIDSMAVERGIGRLPPLRIHRETYSQPLPAVHGRKGAAGSTGESGIGRNRAVLRPVTIPAVRPAAAE